MRTPLRLVAVFGPATLVGFLAAGCSSSDAPSTMSPAAGSGTGTGTGTGSGTGTSSDGGDGGAGLKTPDGGGSGPDGGPVIEPTDGGDEVACSGTATCASGDACISSYSTAKNASAWCPYQGLIKRVTEFPAACSGFDVVQVASGVVGASTTYYYDVTSGALVATLRTSLNTNMTCTGTPAEVSGTPCDEGGVVTTLADSCTD